MGVVGAGIQKPEMHDLGVQKIPETKAKQKVRIANSSLIEDSVDGVHCDLDLSGVSDEPLHVSETNIRRGHLVPLVVGNDLYPVMPPNTDAQVRGAKVDADRWPVSSLSSHGRRSSKSNLRENMTKRGKNSGTNRTE